MPAIGRWGPVQTYGGRTEGEPCTAALDLCDDRDVTAWLIAAKTWKGYAHQLRDVVVTHWGTNPEKWPELARHGELAYVDADKLLAGDLGWLDSSKVETLAKVQRELKLAMEAWAVALEQFFDVKIDVGSLSYDASEDPKAIPPVIPLPDLPDIPKVSDLTSSFVRIAAIGLASYVVVSLLLRRR